MANTVCILLAVTFALCASPALAASGLGLLKYLGTKASISATKNTPTSGDLNFDSLNVARDPRALSIPQLMECLRVQDRASGLDLSVRASKELIQRKRIAADNMASQIQAQKVQIESEEKDVRYDEEKRALMEKIVRYNMLIGEHNDMWKRLEIERIQHNDAVTEHRKLASKFNLDCVGKPYYERDFETVQASIHVQSPPK